jgi:hypothetical protein
MDDFCGNRYVREKGKSVRKQKRQRESVLEQVKKEHPNLPRAVQESVARAKALLEKSKQLGDWKIG